MRGSIGWAFFLIYTFSCRFFFSSCCCCCSISSSNDYDICIDLRDFWLNETKWYSLVGHSSACPVSQIHHSSCEWKQMCTTDIFALIQRRKPHWSDSLKPWNRLKIQAATKQKAQIHTKQSEAIRKPGHQQLRTTCEFIIFLYIFMITAPLHPSLVRHQSLLPFSIAQNAVKFA